MSTNIKLILEYDGSRYHGWQSQAESGRPTIQDTLSQSIVSLSGEKPKIHASGRTDAGVHAFGHVANFMTSHVMPPEAWAPALNHLLPPDIRIVSAERVPPGFHARFSALGKIYNYRILNRRSPTALFRNYAWHVHMPLNVQRMRKAAAFLVGQHDFSAFRGAGCTAKTPIRTLRSVSIRKSGDFLELIFEADAYLRYMVRNITGTLVETGLGRFHPEDVKTMLERCDRKLAGRTAPPQGLYLVRVTYPDDYLLPRPGEYQ